MDKYFTLDGEHLLGSEKDVEYLKYAEAYKRTVMVLLEVLEKSLGYDDFDAIPLLFNFRHYLELQMTGLIKRRLDLNKATQIEFIRFNEKSVNTHSLTFYLENLVRYDSSIVVPQEIKKVIIELNRIDKKGDSFRYPESNKGFKHYRRSINADFYRKIARFSTMKEIMIKCIEFFEGIEEKYEMEEDALRIDRENS